MKKIRTHRFNLRTKSTVTSQPTEQRFRHKENYWCTLESINKNLTPEIKTQLSEHILPQLPRLQEGMKISGRP